MWLGPPTMNRKMHRFAFAGKCPAFAARGEADGPPESAVASFASKSASASKPKPPPDRFNQSRRLSGGPAIGEGGPGQRRGDGRSVDIGGPQGMYRNSFRLSMARQKSAQAARRSGG